MHQHGNPITDHDHMHQEWLAWQAVVGEFKALGLDISTGECSPLVTAIELWGEELHALRHTQPDDTVNHAYDQKRERAEKHQTDTAKQYLADLP